MSKFLLQGVKLLDNDIEKIEFLRSSFVKTECSLKKRMLRGKIEAVLNKARLREINENIKKRELKG